MLATGSEEGRVFIWDAATLKQMGCVRGHMAPVTAVAFHPARPSWFASAAEDGHSLIQVWDYESGQQLACFGRRNALYCSLAFSPCGSMLAAAGAQCKAVQVWRLRVRPREEGEKSPMRAASKSISRRSASTSPKKGPSSPLKGSLDGSGSRNASPVRPSPRPDAPAERPPSSSSAPLAEPAEAEAAAGGAAAAGGGDAARAGEDEEAARPPEAAGRDAAPEQAEDEQAQAGAKAARASGKPAVEDEKPLEVVGCEELEGHWRELHHVAFSPVVQGLLNWSSGRGDGGRRAACLASSSADGCARLWEIWS